MRVFARRQASAHTPASSAVAESDARSRGPQDAPAHADQVAHDFRLIPVHRPSPPILRKAVVSTPGDAVEREAEDVADEVMRMPESGSAAPPEAILRAPSAPTATATATATAAATMDTGTAVRAASRGGTPLARDVRSFFESRFAADFSGVRVHADSDAANGARAVHARAYTIGRDIVFGSGEYAPSTAEGKRLLAHELAHVVQGGQRPRRGVVLRQPKTAPPVRQATVAEAADFLEEMARFIQSEREFAVDLVHPVTRAVSTTVRQRAHRMLSQQSLRDFITNARHVFELQGPTVDAGDPAGTRLRAALLGVLAKVRAAAPDALSISDAMDTATRDAERGLNAQLMAELIETDPFTSAGLATTPAFTAAETAAGTSHEAFIQSYLDDLIRTLPGQTLAAAARDQILNRITVALRRAFVTVAAGPAGTIDVRGITNAAIVEKYRRVVELLSAAMTARPPQLSIITDPMPAYTLPPDPVPDVTPQLQASTRIGAVDFTRVPATELAYVRHGVLQAAHTIFPAGVNEFRNASWSLALQVRRGGTVVLVRYELIFDATKNVRVERLGDAAPREVAPAFASLSVAAKKTQLIADFGLSGVDDRPAAGSGARARAAARWTGPELDQVKAVYDLIPPADRAALRGVAIVRDHHGPALTGGRVLEGFTHDSADAAHDAPGPPAHAPPHIHYYDDAFTQNRITAVGAPGSSGPGADWTVAHEFGHMRMFAANVRASAAMTAANAQVTAANALLPALGAGLPQAQHVIRVAYGNARSTADAAISAVNAAVISSPPAAPAVRAARLQAAQAAVIARDAARANLATAGVPAGMVRAATAADAAADAVLAASLSIGAAADQIPTFVSLAGTFGFRAFTDYGRTANDEWFAETYALFLTDPNRLSQMNRSIFLWFQAGMPMNPGWRPPP